MREVCIQKMGVPMAGELGADATTEFTDAEDLKELQDALLSTQSVEQFLHEMAVLAARMVGGGLSCGIRPPAISCGDNAITVIAGGCR